MTPPQQDGAAANPFDPFAPWKAMRDASMDTWSKTMVDFVNSEEYARASAQWLDTYLAVSHSFQKVLDQAMTQTLNQYNIPTAADLARLAERLTNIEFRLDDLDARLDEVLGLLRRLDEATAATNQQGTSDAQTAAPADACDEVAAESGARTPRRGSTGAKRTQGS